MYPTIISPAQAAAFAFLTAGDDIVRAGRRGESRRAHSARHAATPHSARTSRPAASEAADV